MKYWNIEDLNYLKENYGKIDNSEIAKKLNKTENSIKHQQYKLKLKSNKHFWTKEEDQFLKENYGKIDNSEIAKKLNKTIKVILRRKKTLKIQKQKYWSKEEDQFLIDNYHLMSNKEISKKLNRTIPSINHEARFLNLSKPVNWTDEEIEYLKENFSNKKTEEISKKLNMNKNKIKRKAKKLNLKKTKECISKIKTENNIACGNYIQIEELKERASKYKTKEELRFCDRKCYNILYNRGLLDEACKHMISQKYSIPQLIMRYILDTIIKEKVNIITEQ